MKKLLLSLLTFAATALPGFAAEESATLPMGGTDNGTKNWPDQNQYTATITSNVEVLGTKWIASALSNNNNATTWGNSRCGNSKKVTTASISNKTAISEKITKFVVNTTFVKTGTKDKLTAAKLYVADNSAFSNPATYNFEGYSTAGDWTFEVPAEAIGSNKFYKIELSCQQSTNNGWLGLNNVKIYYTVEDTSNKTEVGLSFNPSEKKFNLGDTFEAPTFSKTITEANVTFAVSGDEGILSVDNEGNVTSKLDKVGTATVTAYIAADDANYYAEPATYTLTVVDPNAPQEIYASAMGDDFNFTNPTGLEVWTHDATYGLKGNGYINSKPNAAEAIAASPVIDCTSMTELKLNFSEAFNQYKENNVLIDIAQFSGYAYIVAKEEGATEWTAVCEATAPEKFSWDYYSNAPIDLSAYSGKKIQIGFKYVSTATVAGTWEIKNISITGKPGTVTPPEPEKQPAELSFAETSLTVVEDGDFNAPTLINPHNLTVTYKSSDVEVAMVETDGSTVIIGKPGTVTITATFEGDDTYAAGSASYTITVTPKPVLGAITVNGEVAEKDKTYPFVEGTEITFASENAEELEVVIYTEDLNKVTTLTEVSSATWTPNTVGTYMVTVASMGCDDLKDIEFFLNITEKPIVTDIEADFIFTGDNANVTTMVAEGVTLTPTNSGTSNGVNDLVGKPLTSENGIKVEFSVDPTSTAATIAHPKYFLSNSSTTKGQVEARLYKDNLLTITAPEGYQLSEITFTKGFSNDWSLTTTDGTMGTDAKSWTKAENGYHESVVFSGKSYIGAIHVKAVKSPEQPVIEVDGIAYGPEEEIDLENGSKVVKITVAEGHHIYHRHDVAAAPTAVVKRVAEESTFIPVEKNVAEVTISRSGQFYCYALHPESGLKSKMHTLTFVGEDPTSIDEIESATSAASEWFDLQGRRINRPAKGGVYIHKQGSTVSKRAL